MDVVNQDPTVAHASLDNGRDGNSGHDSSPGASHDHSLSGQTDDASDPGDAGNGGAGAHPHPTQRSSLGWQSLLPGSIQ